MSRSGRTHPVRMCIGCRGRDDKQGLLRLVSGSDGVRVDDTHTAPGRGAYLHRRSSCLTQAVRRRALGRALRLEGQPVDLERATAGLVSTGSADQ